MDTPRPRASRNRIVVSFVLIGVILLGLGSRRFQSHLPAFVAEYAGDTLWAAAVYLMLALLWPRARVWKIGLGALLFSYAIEVSQLYHAAWIDSMRATTLGGLILGFGFLWSDLLCYSVGIVIAMAIDQILIAWTARRSRPCRGSDSG